MGLNVLFGGEHRAPGGLAAGAVSEAADHPIAEPVVVAEPLALAEHRRRRSAALQPGFRALQAGEAADAPVVARFEAAAAAAPAPIGSALDLHHSDAHILHRGSGHLQQGAADRIVCCEAEDINAAAPLRQQLPQRLEGQRAADHLPVGGGPGSWADVFEVHRQQCPLPIKGREGEEVVVESEATVPQRITPLQQHLTAVALRQQQLILQGHAGVGALLFRSAETIAGQGDGAAQGLKGEHPAGASGGWNRSWGCLRSARRCSRDGQTGA
ncbi:hypothetical protein LBMAG41_10400 [Cyanobium sp.]|nr:hypothetical protein LBMAG41_10400 [Cyanobium sp.]